MIRQSNRRVVVVIIIISSIIISSIIDNSIIILPREYYSARLPLPPLLLLLFRLLPLYRIFVPVPQNRRSPLDQPAQYNVDGSHMLQVHLYQAQCTIFII